MVLLASENSNLYKLPITRAAFALETVRDRAQVLRRDDFIRLLEIALTDTRWAMQLVMSFRAGHTSQYPPAARKMDGVVDHLIVGGESYLQAQVRIYRGEPRGDAAERLLRIFFPRGVGAITRLPFVEEQAEVEALLQRAATDELADDIALLPELPDWLQRLTERNREYGALLGAAATVPTRTELRQAQAQCQERVTQVMFYIISYYGLLDPDNTEERDHLLEPIMQQNEAARLARRRHRSPGDVDPETGEELEGQPDLAGPDDEDLDGLVGEPGTVAEGGDDANPSAGSVAATA